MIKNVLFENCIIELSKLPGIGRKTAERLALFIIKMKSSEVDSLVRSIKDLNEKFNIAVSAEIFQKMKFAAYAKMKIEIKV